MSCRTTSIEELERTIPVKPPKVKRKIKPIAQTIGASHLTRDITIVEIHLKILIPVGTPIIIVAAVK